jgi:hypothetical protein
MKKNIITSDIDLSYDELQGLEAHFRQIQKDAVVRTLHQTPMVMLRLLRKILTRRIPADYSKSLSAEPEYLETDKKISVHSSWFLVEP